MHPKPEEEPEVNNKPALPPASSPTQDPNSAPAVDTNLIELDTWVLGISLSTFCWVWKISLEYKEGFIIKYDQCVNDYFLHLLRYVRYKEVVWWWDWIQNCLMLSCLWWRKSGLYEHHIPSAYSFLLHFNGMLRCRCMWKHYYWCLFAELIQVSHILSSILSII